MAFTGAVEAAQKSGNTTGLSPTAQAVTNAGNYGNTGGVNVSPLIQNLLNYKTGQPFDNQKNYTSKPVTMKTTAAGTDYGVPIGPVPQGSTKSPAAYDPADVAIAQAAGAAKSVDSTANNNYGYSADTIARAKAALEAAKQNQTGGTMANTSPNNTAAQNANLIAGASSNPADAAAYLSALDNAWAVTQNANAAAQAAQQALNGTKPGNAVDDGSAPSGDGSQNSGGTGGGTGGSGGGGSGGGGSGGGGGYGSAAALAGLLGGGTGLTPIGGGTGTGTPYVPIATGAGANSAEAAAAYAQLLQQAGYDLNQPLTGVELPNRVDLPQEVALPENFDFQRAWEQAADVDIGRINHIDTHPEEEMLGQITDLQSQQAILNADNTVKNGIVELQRVMQDAQRQYQDQRNQISMDEQRALDNQVLYNEARGDRGGIGQEQYNTIQNTAATNRMTVQQEQTQLATDTARQIADLRSQGEFEKANQLLNISQKYLSELMDLYQWAKETNLGIDEFNLQVAQWEENFKLSLIGAELDADAFNLNVANAMMDQQNNLFNARFNQENSLFDARLNAAKLQNDEAAARLSAQLNAANATGAFANGTPTYAAQQDAIANQLKERELLADVGLALIKAGVQPSEAILNAMGMGGMASAGTGTAMAGTLSGVLGQLGFSDATSALRAMGIGSAGLAGIAAMGMTPEQYLANALGVSAGVAGLPALGSTTTTTVPSGAEQMLSQLEASPNYYSEVAAYSAPAVTTPTVTQPTGYTDANVYAAFGADPETVLRAMGVGSDGMAGLAYLGLTPAQFIGQAFGL